jgi:phosphoribosyl 1,2-cyclic phosphodiesterase
MVEMKRGVSTDAEGAGPRFTVLASGSSGNASLLEVDGFGLLIDIGLGLRQLTARMAASGRSWRHVHAVVLTHTHGDHWNVRTLAGLLARRIPLYCHDEHRAALREACVTLYQDFDGAGLLRCYGEDEVLRLGRLECRPLPVRHDSGATFGFRIRTAAREAATEWSLGYVADLGCWDDALVDALAEVDLLAIEFNHDVTMQQRSGRHPMLIARVLGDEGHLSNEQAADLLREILRRSAPGRVRQLVQLHLSRQCNRPDLALAAAQVALDSLGVELPIHAARQDKPSPHFELSAPPQPAGAQGRLW